MTVLNTRPVQVFITSPEMVNYEGRDIEMTRSGINESRFVLGSGAKCMANNGCSSIQQRTQHGLDITTGSTIGIPTAFSFTNDGDVCL